MFRLLVIFGSIIFPIPFSNSQLYFFVSGLFDKFIATRSSFTSASCLYELSNSLIISSILLVIKTSPYTLISNIKESLFELELNIFIFKSLFPNKLQKLLVSNELSISKAS